MTLIELIEKTKRRHPTLGGVWWRVRGNYQYRVWTLGREWGNDPRRYAQVEECGVLPRRDALNYILWTDGWQVIAEWLRQHYDMALPARMALPIRQIKRWGVTRIIDSGWGCWMWTGARWVRAYQHRGRWLPGVDILPLEEAWLAGDPVAKEVIALIREEVSQ